MYIAYTWVNNNNGYIYKIYTKFNNNTVASSSAGRTSSSISESLNFPDILTKLNTHNNVLLYNYCKPQYKSCSQDAP